MKQPLTFGSLFAGIGGFDLGFERAGMVCKWQVEINEFCRKVLAKHWPNVPRHDDVRTFPHGNPEAWKVDVICGGFPCQDISVAGAGAGIDGERSGLWSEYARIVRVLRPRYVVVENVPALLGRGLHRVLGDLAACGYDAEWDCIPAAAFGSTHIRERIFIIASRREVLADTIGLRRNAGRFDGSSPHRGDTDDRATAQAGRWGRVSGQIVGNGVSPERVHDWTTEPAVGRVADGVPDRVDRLRGLGNAVVPQVAEWIGRRLVEQHGGNQ